MVHPLFMAEGMGWELSPTELREGSKAWLLALCQGGLHPALCPAPLVLCAEGAVGRLHTQAVPSCAWSQLDSSSRVGLCQGRPSPLRELPSGCDTNWAPAD